MRGHGGLRSGLGGTGHQHNQVAVFVPHRSFLRDLGRGFGELVGDALEVFENLRAALGVEHGLDVVTLFARKFADLGRADGNHRQVGVDGQFLQVLWHEAVTHVGKSGQAQVGLVDAVEPDGFVIVHARKRRFDFVTGGAERGRQKSFDYFPHALGLRV